MKQTYLWILVSVILLLLFVFRSKMSMYDDEIWSKYKLKPVKSTELDALMKTLQEQKKAYESAKGVGEKMKLRIDFEKTRMDIREWYTAKGQELGLDKDAANNFALDIIMKNSI